MRWLFVLALMSCGSPPGVPEAPPAPRREAPERVATPAFAPDRRIAALEDQLRAIAAIDGTVAATVIHLPSGARAHVHGDARLPMMSVFKLPLALLMLREIDAGRRRLDEAVPLTERELRPGVSPVAEAWQRGEKAPALSVLLRTVLVDSDNTSGDKLVTMLGGGAAITAALRGLGIDGVTIAEQEIEISARIDCPGRAAPAAGWTPAEIARCHADGAAISAALQHEIAAAPNAASTDGLAALLVAIDRGGLMSAASQAWLIDTLAATRIGAGRLRAGLPAGTRLAHRTGTGSTRGGVNLATNDIGLVWLPDGTRLVVAVLTAGQRGDDAAREATIAAVARAAYRAFTAP